MAKKVINAFNVGEVSPNVYARTDNELYNSACLKMENFLPLEYGGATRRPATEFISGSEGLSVLHPFVFNADTTYNLVFTNESINIYKDNLSQTSIESEYLESELYDIKFFQSFDVLFIVHKNHPVRKLSRTSDTEWSLEELTYSFPPTLGVNNNTTFSLTGSSIVNEAVNITATNNIFYSTHVGSEFVLRQERDNSNLTLSGEADGTQTTFLSEAINASFDNWSIETSGQWRGRVVVLRSLDNGETYEDYVELADTSSTTEDANFNKNFTFASTGAEGANTHLKVKWIGASAVTPSYKKFTFSIRLEDTYLYAPCEIISVGSGATETVGVNTATAILKSSIIDTLDDYTTTWNGGESYAVNAKVKKQAVFSVISTNKAGNGNTDSAVVTGSLTDTTASVALASHGFTTNDLVAVSGCSDPEYNGTYKVGAVTDSNNFTYELAQFPTDATPSSTEEIGKQVNFQLQDGSSTNLSNVRDMTVGSVNGTETLFVLCNNKVVHKYTISNGDAYNISYTHAGNFTLDSGNVRDADAFTGIVFYNDKLYAVGHQNFYNNDRDNAYIDEFQLDGTRLGQIYRFPIQEFTSFPYGTRETYGIGVHEGNLYVSRVRVKDTQGSTGTNYDSYYRVDIISISGTKISAYLIDDNSNPSYSFDNTHRSFFSKDGKLWVLNDTANSIEEYNNELVKQDESYPLSNKTFNGIACFGNNVYAVASDGIILRFAYSGALKYYQAQEAHTSDNDFDVDFTAGRWSERFPNKTTFEEGAFSGYRGYPESVALFENRLCFGGTRNAPNTLYISELDNLNNFHLNTLDTAAMQLTINSGTLDEIKWLCPARELIIGTASNEWSLGSGSDSLPITPTQFNIKRRSQYGSSSVQGTLVNSAVLFMMRQNKKLREWYLQDNQEDYLAQDLAFIAEHITGNGIKQIAVQTQPTTVVWMVRDDGELIGLTYERESKTVAWHRQKFDGLVESVSVLPTSNGEDKVYLSVKLDITDNTNTDIAYPTVTETHPNAVTTFTKSSHGFSDNDAVKLTNFNVTSQNYQVTPYDDKVYKVVNATTNTFQLADILDNKIPSPAFNLSADAFTSSSAAIGNYVLLSGDGTIDDSSTKWVHLNTYLDNKTTGEYYYFDIRDGKWNFGIYTAYSIALSADSTQSKYVWDVGTWGDGAISASPFNNSNWNGGSATGNVQDSKCTVTAVADDRDLNRRIFCCFDPINWGTDYLTEYNGLDFYKKDDPALNVDLDLSTVTNGVYTTANDGAVGDWHITVSNNGTVSVLANQFKLDGSPDTDNAAFKLTDALIEGDSYELVYKVINTSTNAMMIKGDPIGSDGYDAAQGDYFILNNAVGTYTVRFTADDGVTDGDAVDLHFQRRGGGSPSTGSEQTLELVSLKKYRTEITGLDDLNGQTVSVSVDSVFLEGQYRVSDGKITIDQTAGLVRIGEKYTSTLAPLYIDAQGTQGSKKSIQHAVIRFKDTKEAKVGQKENSLEAVKFGSSTALNTEDAEVWLENANEFLQTIYVVQDAPTPCTVLAMVVDVEGV